MESSSKRILVVDDKPNNLSLVTSLLRPAYEVMLANNGERAIQIATEKLPDLILLDIMMPGMSGFEVCERLKSQPLTAIIPVIFLTARNDGEDFEKAYDIGAVDYVTKPINAKELIMRVRTHLLISEQRNNMVMLNERITEINEGLEVEVKKRTADLYKALRRLEIQNDDLARFSHIISHNLRGPVASALGLFQLLRMEDLSKGSNTEVLARLKDSILQVDLILKEIGGILDIRENTPSAPENFKLHDAIATSMGRIAMDLELEGAVIREEFSTEETVWAVREYLEDVLYRLIHNAVVYRSPDRNPEVVIRFTREEGLYLIDVCDNGVGIDPKNWEKVFEPYKRLSYSSTGRGLGLYLAMAKVQAMNGGITVESDPGAGSVFHVILPAAGPSAGPDGSPEASKHSG